MTNEQMIEQDRIRPGWALGRGYAVERWYVWSWSPVAASNEPGFRLIGDGPNADAALADAEMHTGQQGT